MRLLLVAFQFLTIIPLPLSPSWRDEADGGRSMAFFPLVGLLLGGGMVLADRLLQPLLPPGLLAALLVALLALATGALHLDGVADVCDALGARGDRERFLRVMKDSTTGAIGAAGLVLVLLIKWQAIASLAPSIRWEALLLFPMFSRMGMVLVIVGAPRARSDGLGAAFALGAGRVALCAALLTAAGAATLLLGIKGLLPFIGAALTASAIRLYFLRRIGGITGDIIGCANELGEIVCLCIFTLQGVW